MQIPNVVCLYSTAMRSNVAVQFHFLESPYWTQDQEALRSKASSILLTKMQMVYQVWPTDKYKKLQTSSLSQMVWVGNTGSTLESKYFIVTLASIQGVYLITILIVIMMTAYSCFIGHLLHFIPTKNYYNQSVSRTHIMCTHITHPLHYVSKI